MNLPILDLEHLIWFLVFTHTTVASRIACHGDLYGAPRAPDCDTLLKSFAWLNDDQPRIFDEEQLRVPNGQWFPGVKNEYSTHVAQMPAYWSLSQSFSVCLNLTHMTEYYDNRNLQHRHHVLRRSTHSACPGRYHHFQRGSGER